MQHSLRAAFIFILLLNVSQAEDAPAVVMLKQQPGARSFSSAFSPDGKKILVVNHSVPNNNGRRNTVVQILDADTGCANFGGKLQQLKGHTSRVMSVTFSSDGKKIMAMDREGQFDQDNRRWIMGDCTIRIIDLEHWMTRRPKVEYF